MEVARRLIAVAEQRQPEGISAEDLLAGVSLRGLVWHEASSGEHYATAAGIVLLARGSLGGLSPVPHPGRRVSGRRTGR